MALQILTIDKCLQTLKKNYGRHLLHFIKIVPKKYRIKWSFSPQMKSEIFVWPVKRKNCWCLKTKGYFVTSALIYRPDPRSVGLFLTGFINSKKSALEAFFIYSAAIWRKKVFLSVGSKFQTGVVPDQFKTN